MTDQIIRAGDDLPVVVERRWRKQVPEDHRSSLDTRVQWLWHQRFGTVQTIYTHSPDILDKTAATLILQAIMARDLVSIRQVFQRLEGGSQFDEDVFEQDEALPI
jgi:hypothetical protein